MEELDRIDRYLAGGLSSAERAEFEREAAADPGFAAKLAEVRLMSLGIREAALSNQLNEFHGGLGVAPSTKVISMKRWLVAASVLVLISVAAWFLVPRGSEAHRGFEAYYQKDPGMISAMGTTDNYIFDKAMIDYKQGNYSAAIASWQSLSKTDPANDTLNYFIASALLADKQPAQSVPYFQKVLPVTTSPFLDETNWYLGLALLAQGQTTAAITYLEKSDRPEKTALLRKLKK